MAGGDSKLDLVGLPVFVVVRIGEGVAPATCLKAWGQGGSSFREGACTLPREALGTHPPQPADYEIRGQVESPLLRQLTG